MSCLCAAHRQRSGGRAGLRAPAEQKEQLPGEGSGEGRGPGARQARQRGHDGARRELRAGPRGVRAQGVAHGQPVGVGIEREILPGVSHHRQSEQRLLLLQSAYTVASLRRGVA